MVRKVYHIDITDMRGREVLDMLATFRLMDEHNLNCPRLLEALSFKVEKAECDKFASEVLR